MSAVGSSRRFHLAPYQRVLEDADEPAYSVPRSAWSSRAVAVSVCGVALVTVAVAASSWTTSRPAARVTAMDAGQRSNRLWSIPGMDKVTSEACQQKFLHLSWCDDDDAQASAAEAAAGAAETSTTITTTRADASTTLSTTAKATTTGTTTTPTATETSTSTDTSTTTVSSTTVSSTTVTSTTVTSTTVTETSTSTQTKTTTQWLPAIIWSGCYSQWGEEELTFRNELPRPRGFTSSACLEACRDFKFALLKNNGHCACLAAPPHQLDFERVPDEKCGQVCEGEEDLEPKRLCGGEETFAGYIIEELDPDLKLDEEDSDDNRTNDEISGEPFHADPPLAVQPHAEQPREEQPKKKAPPTLWTEGLGKHALNKTKKQVLKGIAYAPVPVKAASEAPLLSNEDFMAEGAETLWGKPTSKARGDLSIISALGANVVSVSSNDPENYHKKFLDEAESQGLEVIVGFSDAPYLELDGNCATTDFNCYDQVRQHYKEYLYGGFLTLGNVYHPALKTIVLMNEPELKFPGGPKNFCKAAVSAFDAILALEKEFGIVGQAPSLSVTFSFAVCPTCQHQAHHPALGQMLELQEAMRHPESVGYVARNDLWAAYKRRFANSFTSVNPVSDVIEYFLEPYSTAFSAVPVFLAGYHNPRALDPSRDVNALLALAEDGDLFMGLTFSEFQVRYDKENGAQRSFGLFGLSSTPTGAKTAPGTDDVFDVWCLEPVDAGLAVDHHFIDYDVKCGPIETNVDYVSDGDWFDHADHVATPTECCKMCQQNDKCISWTWVEDAKLEGGGSPAQCWMKDGMPLGKVPKDGVISGLIADVAGDAAGAVSSLQADASERRLALVEAPRDVAMPVNDQQVRFGQCGGEFYEGPTKCMLGWLCQERSPLFSQCVPSPDDEAEKKLTLPAEDSALPNLYVHNAIARAFGGSGLKASDLCR